MEPLLDSLWSAQYLAPGAMCAFAGGAGGAHSHALTLRFGSLEVSTRAAGARWCGGRGAWWGQAAPRSHHHTGPTP